MNTLNTICFTGRLFSYVEVNRHVLIRLTYSTDLLDGRDTEINTNTRFSIIPRLQDLLNINEIHIIVCKFIAT